MAAWPCAGGQDAILRAIELNGAAVGLNKRAFLWGRILADQPALMKQMLDGLTEGPPADLDALIAHRAAALTAYQSKRYAKRYQVLIRDVVARETAVSGAPGRLSRVLAPFRAQTAKHAVERWRNATPNFPVDLVTRLRYKTARCFVVNKLNMGESDESSGG